MEINQEQRFANICKEIPLLETVDDPIIKTIVRMLKNTNGELILENCEERLDSLERIIQYYKEKKESEEFENQSKMYKSKDESNPLTIILLSSDDENEEQHDVDEEIIFYNVNKTIKTEQLSPKRNTETKCSKTIYKEKNLENHIIEISDDESSAETETRIETSDVNLSLKCEDESSAETETRIETSDVTLSLKCDDESSAETETRIETSDFNLSLKCNDESSAETETRIKISDVNLSLNCDNECSAETETRIETSDVNLSLNCDNESSAETETRIETSDVNLSLNCDDLQTKDEKRTLEELQELYLAIEDIEIPAVENRENYASHHQQLNMELSENNRPTIISQQIIHPPMNQFNFTPNHVPNYMNSIPIINYNNSIQDMAFNTVTSMNFPHSIQQHLQMPIIQNAYSLNGSIPITIQASSILSNVNNESFQPGYCIPNGLSYTSPIYSWQNAEQNINTISGESKFSEYTLRRAEREADERAARQPESLGLHVTNDREQTVGNQISIESNSNNLSLINSSTNEGIKKKLISNIVSLRKSIDSAINVNNPSTSINKIPKKNKYLHLPIKDGIGNDTSMFSQNSTVSTKSIDSLKNVDKMNNESYLREPAKVIRRRYTYHTHREDDKRKERTNSTQFDRIEGISTSSVNDSQINKQLTKNTKKRETPNNVRTTQITCKRRMEELRNSKNNLNKSIKETSRNEIAQPKKPMRRKTIGDLTEQNYGQENLAGHRTAFILAVEKIKQMSTKRYQSYHYLTGEEITPTVKIHPPKRRKSFVIPRPGINNYYKDNQISQDNTNDYNTEEFSSHIVSKAHLREDEKKENNTNNKNKATSIKNQIQEKIDNCNTDKLTSHIWVKKHLTEDEKKENHAGNGIKIVLKRIDEDSLEYKNSQQKCVQEKSLKILASKSTDCDPIEKSSSKKNNDCKDGRSFKNTDLKYHCQNKNFMSKCIICNKNFNDIVSHYVQHHSHVKNHEIYCSRLPHLIVDKFKRYPLEAKLIQRNPLKFEIECIFCSKKITGNHTEFYEHYSTHTGEYAWKCDSCHKKTPYKNDVIEHCESECKNDAKPFMVYSYLPQNEIIATFCAECNFIQLNRTNVTRHLQKHHLITREPERLCENLVLIKGISDKSKLTSNLIENENKKIEKTNNLETVEEMFEKNFSFLDNDPTNIIADKTTNVKSIDILDIIAELECENKKISSTSTTTVAKDKSDIKKTHHKEKSCNNDKMVHHEKVNKKQSQKNMTHFKSGFIDNLKPWINKTDKLDIEINQKEIKSFNEIISKINLSDFFKCPICTFSTNSADRMINHLKKKHSQHIDLTLDCCYCSEVRHTAENLIDHMIKNHTGCNFQCGKCFYRSISIFNVRLHIEKYHKKSDKIIVCEGDEISSSEQFKILIKSRKRYLKPFVCHLCNNNGDSKFFLENDLETHFKQSHCSSTYCKCDQHELICCCYCYFETNSVDEMRIHMMDDHGNRELFAACRLRNLKISKQIISKSPNSTVFILLQNKEFLPENYFIESKNLKKKLKKISDNHDLFRIIAENSAETILNTKDYLLMKLPVCNNDKFDQHQIKQEFYKMAHDIVLNTGLTGKNLYKCSLKICQFKCESYEQWATHLKEEHNNITNKNFTCPHCAETHNINEFKTHLNVKHGQHTHFCYLCGDTDRTIAAIEYHIQTKHHVSFGMKDKTGSNLPSNYKRFGKFIIVKPDEIKINWGDHLTILSHMRSLFKATEQQLKIHCNSIDGKKIPDANKIPMFIKNNKRYKCANCTFHCETENALENHFKYIHRYITSFECNHCSFKINEKLNNFDRIKDHLRMHSELLYICTKCSFFGHQRQIVQKHVRATHKVEMNITKILRSSKIGKDEFSFETSLEEGQTILAHSFCPICEIDLTEPKKIIEHLSEIHNVKITYECQHCTYSCPLLDSIVNHIKENHKKSLKIRCKYEFIKYTSELPKIPKIQTRKENDKKRPIIEDKPPSNGYKKLKTSTLSVAKRKIIDKSDEISKKLNTTSNHHNINNDQDKNLSNFLIPPTSYQYNSKNRVSHYNSTNSSNYCSTHTSNAQAYTTEHRSHNIKIENDDIHQNSAKLQCTNAKKSDSNLNYRSQHMNVNNSDNMHNQELNRHQERVAIKTPQRSKVIKFNALSNTEANRDEDIETTTTSTTPVHSNSKEQLYNNILMPTFLDIEQIILPDKISYYI